MHTISLSTAHWYATIDWLSENISQVSDQAGFNVNKFKKCGILSSCSYPCMGQDSREYHANSELKFQEYGL